MELEDFAMILPPNPDVAEMLEMSNQALDLVREIIRDPRVKAEQATRTRKGQDLIEIIQSMVLSAERVLHEKDHQIKPCWYCGMTQTPTQKDLEAHIETASQSAAWAAWPKEEFVAKMRFVLGIGDRVVWVGAGYAQVRRRDGRIDAVYRREG